MDLIFLSIVVFESVVRARANRTGRMFIWRTHEKIRKEIEKLRIQKERRLRFWARTRPHTRIIKSKHTRMWVIVTFYEPRV